MRMERMWPRGRPKPRQCDIIKTGSILLLKLKTKQKRKKLVKISKQCESRYRINTETWSIFSLAKRILLKKSIVVKDSPDSAAFLWGEPVWLPPLAWLSCRWLLSQGRWLLATPETLATKKLNTQERFQLSFSLNLKLL